MKLERNFSKSLSQEINGYTGYPSTDRFISIYVLNAFNLYPTNALRPFKAASYERTKKFKCPIHSCRGLELQSRSLSPHYITVCGQIHAPATFPNYVYMYIMDSSF